MVQCASSCSDEHIRKERSSDKRGIDVLAHAVNSSDNHLIFSREWPEARMAKQSMQNPIKDDEKKSKKEEDQELSEELEMSFPQAIRPLRPSRRRDHWARAHECQSNGEEVKSVPTLVIVGRLQAVRRHA